jgi:hypothetical protein
MAAPIIQFEVENREDSVSKPYVWVRGYVGCVGPVLLEFLSNRKRHGQNTQHGQFTFFLKKKIYTNGLP